MSQTMNKHPSTPVNVKELSKNVFSHPHRRWVNFLITGLNQGFLAGLSLIPTSIHVYKNLMSALKEPEIVDNLIKEELDKDYLICPFNKSVSYIS